MSDKDRCVAKVLDHSSWNSTFPCSRRGTIKRDGKLYCKQHDPVAIAEKEAARCKNWARKTREETKKINRRRLEHNVCKDCTNAQLKTAIRRGGVRGLLDC